MYELIERAKLLTKYSDFYFIEQKHNRDEFYEEEHNDHITTNTTIFGITGHVVVIEEYDNCLLSVHVMGTTFYEHMDNRLLTAIELFELYLNRNDFIKRGVSRRIYGYVEFTINYVNIQILLDGSIMYRTAYHPMTIFESTEESIYPKLAKLVELQPIFNEMFDFSVYSKVAIKNEYF